MRKSIAAASFLSLVSAPALGSDKADKAADMGDPNRIICETVKVTGSRLARKKMCHTAGEWADLRRQTKDATSRFQQGLQSIGKFNDRQDN